MHRRDLVLALVAPVILVLVATAQLTAAHTWNLTSWKGGGFGMFATVDRLSERFMRIEVVVDGVPRVVTAANFAEQSGWPERQNRTVAMPDPAQLAKVGNDLASRQWYETTAGVVTLDAARANNPITIEAVRVSVWRVEYNSSDSTLRARLVAERTLPAP